jgi:hypothetical protein
MPVGLSHYCPAGIVNFTTIERGAENSPGHNLLICQESGSESHALPEPNLA